MPDLVRLLNVTGFKEDTTSDLLKALQELDDDADGFVDKETISQALTHLGEGLGREEVQMLLEIATDPNSEKPGLVDINRLAVIMSPEEMKSENEFEKRISLIKKTKQML